MFRRYCFSGTTPPVADDGTASVGDPSPAGPRPHEAPYAEHILPALNLIKAFDKDQYVECIKVSSIYLHNQSQAELSCQ